MEWKMTYGSLGTGVGVSDGDPFTTVGSTGVHAGWQSTDVITVTASQRCSRLRKRRKVKGKRLEERGKFDKIEISFHFPNPSSSLHHVIERSG